MTTVAWQHFGLDNTHWSSISTGRLRAAACTSWGGCCLLTSAGNSHGCSDSLWLPVLFSMLCYSRGGSYKRRIQTDRVGQLYMLGIKLDYLVMVDKLLKIMNNASRPLHTVIKQRSPFSERLKHFFVPDAIKTATLLLLLLSGRKRKREDEKQQTPPLFKLLLFLLCIVCTCCFFLGCVMLLDL